MTDFQIISHACSIIKYNNKKLVTDPWIIGSCYWRSWWNFPEVKKELLYHNLDSEFIYITHVHWDHWHGPTLKKFDKNTTIITHREPNDRSYSDLKSIGFKNIILLNHGESLELDKNFKITPYQFGLFLNDSSLIIETPETKIFNGNDCKIAGAPLQNIIDNHGNFDFALRSHSSANYRACIKVNGKDSDYFEDTDHYPRSFKLFMDKLKPKYAIPFASNHCHLHRDVYHFNDIVNDPYKLKNELKEMGGLKYSKLKIMLSGDSWNSKNGFNLENRENIFGLNKDNYLKKYLKKNNEILNKYYKTEEKVKINQRIFDKFFKMNDNIPFWKRNNNLTFSLKLFSGNISEFYIIKPFNNYFKKIDQKEFLKSKSRISIPSIIFRDSVLLNMFHHSSIAKRSFYEFDSLIDYNNFIKYLNSLELVELNWYPLRFKYVINFINSYMRRWRELLVYFKALILKLKGKQNYEIEEIILKD